MVFQEMRGQSTRALITRLNPIIRGQANYLKTQVASKTFTALDHWLWQKCWKWARATHPTKSAKWRQEKYWGTSQKHPESRNKWVFQDKLSGLELERFSWFKITRHVMVKGRSSPDDPELRGYWETRRLKLSDTQYVWKTLMRSQKGKCPICGDTLLNEERIEMDHIIPRSQGGTNEVDNLQLLHYYCHQQKSALEAKGKKPKEVAGILARGIKIARWEQAMESVTTIGAK